MWFVTLLHSLAEDIRQGYSGNNAYTTIINFEHLFQYSLSEGSV